MRPLVALYVALLGCELAAQMPPEYELAYRRCAVYIERPADGGREVGAGFIVDRRGDSLVVATARHVVQDTASRHAPPGHAVLYNGGPPLPYRLLHLDREDLAFIQVHAPRYTVRPAPPCREAPMDAPVWLLALRAGYVPMPFGFDGRLLARSSNGLHFWAAMTGADQGDSGSAIISHQGVVGMLLGGSDEVRCLDIAYIMERYQTLKR
ncbi:MAG: serine protease [Flavobacteriales bacterium]|jgi:hypothetical protein|nr:MAG: serine protease [Flavobacteriales bacterium]